MLCKAVGLVKSEKRKALPKKLFVLLLLFMQWLLFIQPAESIGRDGRMFYAGFSYGTKAGLVLGMKYFILDDIPVGIDFILGASLGIGLDINYYPAFLGSYVYMGTGFSYILGGVLAFNIGMELNTWTFYMPPFIESENKDNEPTVAYLELGLGRILYKGFYAQDQNPDERWFFPNVTLGLRAGPF
jgi:hypothetical protein